MRQQRVHGKVNTDEENYQYHRTIEDSVDIFYNPDEDGEPHQSEFMINLGDLSISEKSEKTNSKKIKKTEKSQLDNGDGTSQIDEDKDEKVSNTEKHVLNFAEIMKSEGATFQRFDVSFSKIDQLNFEEEINKIKLDERFDVKCMRSNQYLIDGTKFFNTWNPDKIEFMETTVIIVITHITKNQVNILINSIIAENLSKLHEEFWKDLVSNSESLWDAVQIITSELAECSGIMERMKLSSSFYGFETFSELLNSSKEWSNQLTKDVFPNRFDHSTWTTASELLNFGTQANWRELKEKIGEIMEMDENVKNEAGNCGYCKKMTPGHLLFLLSCGREARCAECLRNKFYKEFSVRKIPVCLEIDAINNYDTLSTIMPLTVLNLYTREMYANMSSKNQTESGSIAKCERCRSFLRFENQKNQRFACPCGYCWCNKCKDAPHWPMTCEEYKEWKPKWNLRYNLETAQGTGSEAIIQVTCHCQKLIFYRRKPAETMECPRCKVVMETGGMTRREFFADYPWTPSFKRLFRYGNAKVDYYVKKQENEPYAKITTKLNKIPSIKASVIRSCKSARDKRYDEKLHEKLIRKERDLIRKKVLTNPELGNLLSTILYLIENVNAWMSETNNFDKKVMQKLEEMENQNQREIIKALERNSIDLIKEHMGKLQVNKEFVIKMIKSKLKS